MSVQIVIKLSLNLTFESLKNYCYAEYCSKKPHHLYSKDLLKNGNLLVKDNISFICNAPNTTHLCL